MAPEGLVRRLIILLAVHPVASGDENPVETRSARELIGGQVVEDSNPVLEGVPRAAEDRAGAVAGSPARDRTDEFIPPGTATGRRRWVVVVGPES
jgi:hypothetical protein